MTCKDCENELTMILEDTKDMSRCERCKAGCEVYKQSGQICFPKNKEGEG